MTMHAPLDHPLQAHPRRVAKVTSQIRREISEMFILDTVRMLAAVCHGMHGGAYGDCCGVWTAGPAASVLLARPPLPLPQQRCLQQQWCDLVLLHWPLQFDTVICWRLRPFPTHAPLMACAPPPHTHQPQVVADAISPERKTSFEHSLTALATVSDVYVSNDLQASCHCAALHTRHMCSWTAAAH